MRVLFYTGYFKQPWNPTNQVGIGGSEVSVIKVAESLVKFGWDVYVSGDIEETIVNGINWVPTYLLHKKYFNQFDVIIGVSYIHFILEFEKYNAKKIFWVHNTDYHPWYKGLEINDSSNLLTPDKIDSIVCLTNWHKNQWSQKYSIDPSRIQVIGNGIDPQSFVNINREKVRDRFIWSSAPERGLNELLKFWPNIKKIKPLAELHVYSPGYQIAKIEDIEIPNLKDVIFKGSVAQEVLHNAMIEAEYWMYLTSYDETYCITALEIQYSKVLPITTNRAALKEVVNGGIVLNDDETKWKVGIQTLYSSDLSLRKAVIDDNFNFARKQTWESRSYEWKRVIESV